MIFQDKEYKPKIWNGEQQTDEWFDLHSVRFTSTNATAIKASGKGLTTACKSIIDYERGIKPEHYTNEHIERGIREEPIIRMLYEIETDNIVDEVGFVYIPELPVGDSPDGLVGDDGCVEIKSFSYWKMYDYEKTGKHSYNNQIQWHLWVLDRNWCDFIVYCSELDRLRIKRIYQDNKMFTKFEKGVIKGIEILKEMRAFNKE
jgi:hypothetical protein